MFIALIALLVVQMNFGILPIAQKLALTTLTPLALFAVRSLAAAAIFQCSHLFASTVTAREQGKMSHWRDYLYLSLLGIVLNQFLLILALTMTSAVAAVIVVPSIPLFTYFFAVLLGKESFSYEKSAILLLGGAGVLILFGDSLFAIRQGTEPRVLLGNFLCLLSAAVYAFYFVLSKDHVARQPALTFTSRIFSWALVWTALLLLGSWVVQRVQSPEASWVTLFIHEFRPIHADLLARPSRSQLVGTLVFIVCGPTALNYFLNLWALKRLPPSTVSGFISLQTLIGAGLSHRILGEQLKASYALAAACILLSVFLLSIRSWQSRG